MKLYIDDLRDPSWSYPGTEGWTVARNAEEAFACLATGQVVEVSFDNDLGPNEMEGRRIFSHMIMLILNGQIPSPDIVRCHSANPPAYEFITRTWAAFLRDSG